MNEATKDDVYEACLTLTSVIVSAIDIAIREEGVIYSWMIPMIKTLREILSDKEKLTEKDKNCCIKSLDEIFCFFKSYEFEKFESEFGEKPINERLHQERYYEIRMRKSGYSNKCYTFRKNNRNFRVIEGK